MIIEWLQSLDETITLFINSFYSKPWDHIWQFFSMKETWFPLYAIVLFYLVRRLGWKKGLVMAVSLAATILICDQFANIMKTAVGRLRPCYTVDMLTGGLHVLESRTGFYGFYSAHTANAFGFAVASISAFSLDSEHDYRPYKWFIYFWATMIGLSRIFAGKHFFGDVLVGVIAGLLVGWCLAKMARMVTGRI